MREKKCGCVVFEFGPPVLCATHQAKVIRKQEREREAEEKGLRKIVLDQATENGHELSRFKEYPSTQGKWTAHCHRCGCIAIVYEQVPQRGDQINAKGLFDHCERSALVGTLADADRDGFAARFKPAISAMRDDADGETNERVED